MGFCNLLTNNIQPSSVIEGGPEVLPASKIMWMYTRFPRLPVSMTHIPILLSWGKEEKRPCHIFSKYNLTNTWVGSHVFALGGHQPLEADGEGPQLLKPLFYSGDSSSIQQAFVHWLIDILEWPITSRLMGWIVSPIWQYVECWFLTKFFFTSFSFMMSCTKLSSKSF
jgi:hypothetical protein